MKKKTKIAVILFSLAVLAVILIALIGYMGPALALAIVFLLILIFYVGSQEADYIPAQNRRP